MWLPRRRPWLRPRLRLAAAASGPPSFGHAPPAPPPPRPSSFNTSPWQARAPTSSSLFPFPPASCPLVASTSLRGPARLLSSESPLRRDARAEEAVLSALRNVRDPLAGAGLSPSLRTASMSLFLGPHAPDDGTCLDLLGSTCQRSGARFSPTGSSAASAHLLLWLVPSCVILFEWHSVFFGSSPESLRYTRDIVSDGFVQRVKVANAKRGLVLATANSCLLLADQLLLFLFQHQWRLTSVRPVPGRFDEGES